MTFIPSFLDSANGIQYGQTGSFKGGTTANATITAVDTTRSIIIGMGIKSNDTDNGDSEGNGQISMAGLTFTSSTNVRGTRQSSDNTYDVYANFRVIQYNQFFVKSIQVGTKALNASVPITQAITTVTNLLKAELIVTYSSGSTGYTASHMPVAKLTDASTITFDCGASLAGFGFIAYWQVIEFY